MGAVHWLDLPAACSSATVSPEASLTETCCDREGLCLPCMVCAHDSQHVLISTCPARILQDAPDCQSTCRRVACVSTHCGVSLLCRLAVHRNSHQLAALFRVVADLSCEFIACSACAHCSTPQHTQALQVAPCPDACVNAHQGAHSCTVRMERFPCLAARKP